MASPGLQEFSENTNMSGNEEVVADVTATLPTPQRSSSSEKKVQSTPTESAPQPQPRTRNMMLQKPDGDEGKDASYLLDVYA